MATIVAVIFLTVVFTSPVWVPALMIVCYQINAKNFWQFSMRFLLALIAAECATLAINVALNRCLPTP